MAIAARVEGQRLVVDFDPRSDEDVAALFNAITAISGDYTATLGSVSEVFVNFGRPDTERKIYAWLQGALTNKKVVTVQPANNEAYGSLRGEENRGVKPWTNLLQPGSATNPPVKRATKPLMRPTRKIEKPVA
ncbi:hypothetical protein PLCT1_01426 [Planctomycetaceae bacterium]|nr:hypothetical protein PLCT1_01426 [Planctomycetaceae bacterium]